MAMTTEQKAIYDAIDEILWHDWDPIGLNNILPRDEYSSYVPVIFSLKITGQSIDVIAQKLLELEELTIGVGGGATHCQRVAAKIVSL